VYFVGLVLDGNFERKLFLLDNQFVFQKLQGGSEGLGADTQKGSHDVIPQKPLSDENIDNDNSLVVVKGSGNRLKEGFDGLNGASARNGGFVLRPLMALGRGDGWVHDGVWWDGDEAAMELVSRAEDVLRL
ncbi:MAG: hypothetical protein SGARI_005668, partial [Bacillariaceae sp.]